MARDRYLEDATVPIEYTALDSSLDPLTGLTDLLVSVRRLSNDQFYDWNDDTFKASGWTTRRQAMSEVDATNAPGDYASSFDLSAVTNKTANDTYVVRIEQSPGVTVTNVPASGEVEEGLNDIAAGAAMDLVTDAVDADAVAASGAQEIRDEILNDATRFAGANVDAAISSRATQAQILNDATPFPGSNIDAAISSRGTADPGDAMDLIVSAITDIVTAVEAQQASVHGAGLWATATGFSVPGDEMNLTPAAVSSVTAGGGGTDPSSTAAAVNSVLSSDHGVGSWLTATVSVVQQGLQDQGYTIARAGKLEFLDTTISSLVEDVALVAAQISGLNDLSQAQAQTAVTSALGAQGYSVSRAGKLDFLDASVLGVPAAIDIVLSAAHGSGLWDQVTDPSSVADEVGQLIIDATGATTFTLDKTLKFMLSKAIGDISRTGNYYTYDEQGGAGLFVMNDNDPISRINSIL